VWPDYGFDEWFLQVALYPRAAFEGLLTFVPASAKSQLLPLDIEYTMWANPASEIQYFGWADGGCCAPKLRGDLPKVKKSTLRKSNGQVLLTGMWKVETPGDVVLINELCAYAAAQDVEVIIKPALHVKNKALLADLSPTMVAQAMLWEGKFSAYIQGAFVRIIALQNDADWIWEADSDERVDFHLAGGLRKVVEKSDLEGADYVPGEWMDRIANGDILPALSPRNSLASQFPRVAKAVQFFGEAWQEKIALHRRDCFTIPGNHVVDHFLADPSKAKKASSHKIPIWHFKWHEECLPNQVVKMKDDGQWHWSHQMSGLIAKLDHSGGTQVPWNSMPHQAWVAIKPEWRRGAYPCGPSSKKALLNGNPRPQLSGTAGDLQLSRHVDGGGAGPDETTGMG
jgi:hypothetical protein